MADSDWTDDYWLSKPKNQPAKDKGQWNGFGVHDAATETYTGDAILSKSQLDGLYARSGANGTIGVNSVQGKAGAVVLAGDDINPATTTARGTIKVGANLSVSADGTLEAIPVIVPGYVVADIPSATQLVRGLVKVGAGLTVNPDGVLSAVVTGSNIPIATATTLGGVKIGNNLQIDSTGTLSSLDSYKLPIATATTLGGVKIGNNLTISSTGEIDPDPLKFVLASEKANKNGVATLDADGKVPASQISAIAISQVFVVANQAGRIGSSAHIGDVAIQTDTSKSYILQQEPASNAGNWVELLASQSVMPPATALTLGGVRVDGRTIGIDGNNVIYSNATLASLRDIDLATTPPVNGQTLSYDQPTNTWKPVTVPTLKFVEMTQAAYAALATKDPQTIYLIHN